MLYPTERQLPHGDVTPIKLLKPKNFLGVTHGWTAQPWQTL